MARDPTARDSSAAPASHPEFRGSILDLDPGFLDHRAPLFGFRLQEGGKRGLTMLLCMGLFSIFC
jgi:hypothetical protein